MKDFKTLNQTYHAEINKMSSLKQQAIQNDIQFAALISDMPTREIE